MVNYTDFNRLPLGVLQHYAIDLDLGVKNNFQLQMNVQDHCMTHGSIWYVEGSEYGGIVDSVKVDTQKSIVYYSGRSWRGILAGKIIEPDNGQDYLIVSGDAHDVLWNLVKRLNLQDFFSVPDISSDIQINNYCFERYTDAYTGIIKMLNKFNGKLKLTMKDSNILLEAVEVQDLSEKYEYSDDYGMQIIMEEDKGGVNHLICLGQGELKDRIVIHLFVNDRGEIVKQQYYAGLQEIALSYDYGNSETSEQLEIKGIEKLTELKNKNVISAQFQKLDVDIGDIVGGKNRTTGMNLKETVTGEIVKIKNDMQTITYKVGDE